MKTNKRSLSNDDMGVLLFFSALLIGGGFRIYIALASNFPINDGGLFYAMIEAVEKSNIALPTYVDYNGLEIPFAYPPLAFQIAAVIHRALQISIMDLLIWMPSITLVAIIPCVYFLSKILLKSTLLAGMAALLYATMPRAITWLIMGGGLTRSLGQLFLILAVSQIYLLFAKGQKGFILSSIVFSIAVCVTHPEATIHTIGAALLMWLFFGKSWSSARNAIYVGIGTLLGSSWWWIPAILRFGIDPFITATQTGLHTPLVPLQLLMAPTEEPFLTTIAICTVIGFFIQVAKRKYFLPAWVLLHFLLEPRSAANVSIIPMAMLASISLVDLIFPKLTELAGKSQMDGRLDILQSRIEKLFLAYVIVSLFFSMSYHSWSLKKKTITPDIQNAMEWIKKNTSKDTSFIIITGNAAPFGDYTNEWFPVLTERRSLTTIQGYEWISDTPFNKRYETISAVQTCPYSIEPLACIETITLKNDWAVDYMVIKKDAKHIGNLVANIAYSHRYRKIFESDDILVFEMN